MCRKIKKKYEIKNKLTCKITQQNVGVECKTKKKRYENCLPMNNSFCKNMFSN